MSVVVHQTSTPDPEPAADEPQEPVEATAEPKPRKGRMLWVRGTSTSMS